MAFSSKLLFFLSPIFVHFLALGAIAQLKEQYHDCYNKGNYTTNTTFEANLNILLDSFSTKTGIDNGFYNFSCGENLDKVYAVGICRPDMDGESCRNCISEASKNITSICPNFILAIAGFDDRGFNNCMLCEAAARNSPQKYAVGDEVVTGILRLYALVQCNPDLSKADCNCCLDDTTNLIPECCDKMAGGRVITPSCSFRYETSKFYESSIEGPAVSPTPLPNPKGKKNRTVIIVVCSVIGSVILILFIGCSIFFRMRKTEGNYENMKDIQNRGSLQFNFSTIRDATDNFSDANKLGQGGFGAVYKGVLSDGEQIAKGFLSEFLPNSSLDHFVFDPIKREFMQWEKRYKIIEGIARGLQYLHEDSRLRIIHRDLKTNSKRYQWSRGYAWLYSSRICTTWAHLSEIRCLQLRCISFGNYERSKDKFFWYRRGNREPSKLCMEKLE
ncbi:hypothetical protein QYF36_004366 [Acer negundo]|nr:hypothetical protein QYF36_004366 [Acer negundo]